MRDEIRLYDLLARLLSYPAADYPHALRLCQPLLREQHPEHSASFDRFATYVQAAPPEELEELFTRTFDLNPVCCLEVGWQLYGEDYNRGTFMVKMRQQLRAHGVPESIELPDHLANLLPLLGRMEPAEAGPLCASSILPALVKMQAGLEGKNNPYEEVLLAVRRLIEPLAAPYPRPAPQLTQIQRKEEVIHD
ncbi:MAG: molecular chaperone TorD family protein [Acidobacteria bacterium]|nr:molecular chaperone TorD family protein [Acidobacteriota bacterium]